jgi:flagellin-like protein
MKILRSRKALSPVVASIILIAVTVAVSIAVAAWMGALTFTFMATEQLSITNVSFASGNVIYVTANNTGTSSVTINEAWVNNVKQTTVVDNSTSTAIPVTITANSGKILKITYTWTNGSNYQVKLVSSKGNQFMWNAIAPS